MLFCCVHSAVRPIFVCFQKRPDLDFPNSLVALFEDSVFYHSSLRIMCVLNSFSGHIHSLSQCSMPGALHSSWVSLAFWDTVYLLLLTDTHILCLARVTVVTEGTRWYGTKEDSTHLAAPTKAPSTMILPGIQGALESLNCPPRPPTASSLHHAQLPSTLQVQSWPPAARFLSMWLGLGTTEGASMCVGPLTWHPILVCLWAPSLLQPHGSSFKSQNGLQSPVESGLHVLSLFAQNLNEFIFTSPHLLWEDE